MKPKYTLTQLKKNVQRIKSGTVKAKEIEGWMLAAFTNYKNRHTKRIWGDGRGIGLEIVRSLIKLNKACCNHKK